MTSPTRGGGSSGSARGAGRSSSSRFAESLALAALGTIAGWVAGGAVAAFVASRAGSPAGDVDRPRAALARRDRSRSRCRTDGRPAALRDGPRAARPRRQARLHAARRRGARGDRGRARRLGPRIGERTAAVGRHAARARFLLLVPALVVFAAAVVAARLLAPTLRALGRAGRRGPIALRLAAASLARNPGHAAIAATFLVASLGLALFAVAYRSTLLRGPAGRGAVRGAGVVRALRGLAPARAGAARRAARIGARAIARCAAPLRQRHLGHDVRLPRPAVAALSEVGGWRTDFASKPLAELGCAITPTRSVALRKTALPRDGSSRSPRRRAATTSACARSSARRSATTVAVPLGTHARDSTVVLHGRVPFRHATLAQLRLDILNSGRITANAGTGLQPSARACSRSDAPRRRQRSSRPFRAGRDRRHRAARPERRELGYVLTPDRIGTSTGRGSRRTATRCPCSRRRTSPRRPGRTGSSRSTSRASRSPARIVGVVQRFPSIQGDAVVADRPTAATLLDTRSPGLGTTGRALARRAGRQQAARPSARAAAVHAAAVASRADTLARCEADPLARGALLTLAGTAAVALLLALVGLVLVGRRRRPRRARRAVRPRGAGRGAVDDPHAPPPARAARRGLRRRGRARARGDPRRRSSSRSSR